jgi:hypothetical protein
MPEETLLSDGHKSREKIRELNELNKEINGNRSTVINFGFTGAVYTRKEKTDLKKEILLMTPDGMFI